MHSSIETYADLLKVLEKLTKKQLSQPIQVVKPGPIESQPVVCWPAIAVGTVEALEFYRCRSVIDNKYRGKDLVIMVDGNPFGKDGATSYEMVRDKNAKRGFRFKPEYAMGKTSLKEQTTPTEIAEESVKEKYIIKSRAKDLDN